MSGNKSGVMRQCFIKTSAVILAMVFAFISTMPVFAAGSQRAARISELTGSVKVMKAGGEKEFKAFKGMSLSEGDRIITGKDSGVTLEIDEDKELKIAENTQMTISELTGAAGTDDTQKTGVGLWVGKIWTNIKKKLNVRSKFEVKTPTTVMGVRGTQFFVGQEEGKTDVAVLSGTVVATAYIPPAATGGGGGGVSGAQKEVETVINENQQVTLDQSVKKQEDVKVKEVKAETLDLFVLETIKEEPQGINQKLLENIDKVIEQKKEEKKQKEEKKKEEEKKAAQDSGAGTGTGGTSAGTGSDAANTPPAAAYDDTVAVVLPPSPDSGSNGSTTPTASTYAGPNLIGMQVLSTSGMADKKAYVDGLDITQFPEGTKLVLMLDQSSQAVFYVNSTPILTNQNLVDAINTTAPANTFWIASLVNGKVMLARKNEIGPEGNYCFVEAMNCYDINPDNGSLTIPFASVMPADTRLSVIETVYNPPSEGNVLAIFIKGIPTNNEIQFSSADDLCNKINACTNVSTRWTASYLSGSDSINMTWNDTGLSYTTGIIDIRYYTHKTMGGEYAPEYAISMTFDKPLLPDTNPENIYAVGYDMYNKLIPIKVVGVSYSNSNTQVTLYAAKDTPTISKLVYVGLKDTNGYYANMGYGVIHIADNSLATIIGCNIGMQYGAYIPNDFPAYLLNGLTKLDGSIYHFSGKDQEVSMSPITSLAGIENLVNLQSLNLDGHSINTAGELSRLSALHYLKDLSIAYNSITDSALSGLSGLASLESLCLDKNCISDLSKLPDLPNLKFLSLGGTCFTTLAPISKYGSTLMGLDISYNSNFDLATLPPPSTMTKLNQISLAYYRDVSKHGSPGFTQFSNAYMTLLNQYSQLHQLDLSGNDIDIDAFNQLIAKSGLECLGISNILVNDSPLSDISFFNGGFASSSSLKLLDISENPISALTVGYIGNLSMLINLNINMISSGLNIGFLSSLTHLSKLSAEGNLITDLATFYDYYTNFAGLEDLDLRNNDINDVSKLSKLTGLKYLSLGYNPILDYSPLDNIYDNLYSADFPKGLLGWVQDDPYTYHMYFGMPIKLVTDVSDHPIAGDPRDPASWVLTGGATQPVIESIETPYCNDDGALCIKIHFKQQPIQGTFGLRTDYIANPGNAVNYAIINEPVASKLLPGQSLTCSITTGPQ